MDGQNDDFSSEEEQQPQSKRAGRRERKTAKRIGKKIGDRHAKHPRLEGADIQHGFASQPNDESIAYMSDVIVESASDEEQAKDGTKKKDAREKDISMVKLYHCTQVLLISFKKNNFI